MNSNIFRLTLACEGTVVDPSSLAMEYLITGCQQGGIRVRLAIPRTFSAFCLRPMYHSDRIRMIDGYLTGSFPRDVSTQQDLERVTYWYGRNPHTSYVTALACGTIETGR